jgi:hypothetical protein
MLAVLGGLADVERDLIRTRTAEGRSRAKAQGKHMGRPPSLTPAQQKEAIRRRAQGATLDELARQLQCKQGDDFPVKPMNARAHIPEHIQHRVLDRSRRRCALCLHFDNDSRQKEGQIAHLDRDPSNFAEDNLAFLCLPHHDDYDTKRRQTKNLTIPEAKTARDRLYAFIEAGGDLGTASQQSNQLGGIRERRVDTLTKLVPDLRKALGYLQNMTRLGRVEQEVSPEYCSACSVVFTSAHATLEDGRLFLPSEFVELCERFFASVVKA